MTGHLSPQPFDRFLESLAAAKYDDFSRQPGSAVVGPDAFEEMRTYLLDLYKDVRVEKSFVEFDGQAIDCVPAEQHPAARRWKSITIAAPPKSPPALESYDTTPPHAVTPATREIASRLPWTQYRDTAQDLPDGTTPMYRTTLQQLARFRNLADFSAKGSVGDFSALETASTSGKRYATGEQDVDCLGGASQINVWKPFATPTFQSTFSQQWYVAGHNGTLMQTVECGWHVDITRYQNADPHLFVYATRQNYDTGHSFYNEDSGVFKTVQNPYTRPGAPLIASQTGGTQVAHKMGFYRTSDAWWFYFDDHAIGCYPLAWFQNGPLTSKATRAKFGGEVGTNLPIWPSMGSGQHASAGYGKAAYQRAAFIHPVGGGAQAANLSVAGSTAGSCYTIDITNNSASDWGTYLFFGGPGGPSC
jgi:hypothetical protein